MIKGLIVYNDYWTSLNVDYCINRLKLSCIKHGIDVSLISGRELTLNIGETVNNKPDFVLLRDKFPNIGLMLENNNIPVFNNSECIRICDDKAEMSAVLSGNNIRRPYTIISPQTYNKGLDKDYLIAVSEILLYPLIVKKIRSSHGIGVSMARNLEELMRFTDYREQLVFEQFIPTPFGQDIRVFVVGDRIIGAIRREGAKGEFRSNIELGGTGSTVQIDDTLKALALSAIKAVGADYGGVDIINSDSPVVLEVNASPGFRCMDTINNIDTASHIIEYILERIG